jgi:hypothetical protein
MEQLKNKIQFFIIGLTVGLLVAGGFFIFKLDDYFKELRGYRNAIQEQEKEADQETNKDQSKLNKNFKYKTTKRSTEAQFKNSNTDSSSMETLNFTDKTGISPLKNDSLTAAKISDSLNKEQKEFEASVNRDDIVVKKDELTGVKYVDLLPLMNQGETFSSKDSVLQQLSGIKETKSAISYKVELWKSPINYKGYKMTKNKLLLYGVNSTDAIKLYKLDEVIYLKLPQATYKLEYTSDFKPFEKISDEFILAKLK